MVIWTYSQKWAKTRYDKRLKELWKTVITKPTPDLWIKVFFYTNTTIGRNLDKKAIQELQRIGISFNEERDVQRMVTYPATSVRGHYRCSLSYGHGFYDTEWSFIRNHPNINHCITLKIGEECTDDYIISLQAHEFRHYLQWKKYGAQMNRRINNRRKRPIQVEKDANKWAKKRVEKLGYKYL